MRNQPVVSLGEALQRVDEAARRGDAVGAVVYPTGFSPLDSYLGGGLRSGELVLLGGAQGLGKTTMALQVARTVAASGTDVVYFSFAHDDVYLLTRLVALEAGLRDGAAAVTLRQVRNAVDSTNRSAGGLAGRLDGLGGDTDVVAAVATYADRILVHRSDGRTTTAEVIENVVSAYTKDQRRPLVVVDYLQRVAVDGEVPDEDERTTRVVESLKDLALHLQVPMLAIVAADKAALAKSGRLRVFHLRGSSALAYEADIVLMLNEKYDAVARRYLVYDGANAERFRGWVVLTVEKNRSGPDRIDLEFRKVFEYGRLDPEGGTVAERLTDERLDVE